MGEKPHGWRHGTCEERGDGSCVDRFAEVLQRCYKTADERYLRGILRSEFRQEMNLRGWLGD